MDPIPTDLVLTLVNITTETNDDKITLSVHKNILAKNSPYFEKLFTNFKESNQEKITIYVHNIRVTRDIIMGFYGKEPWFEQEEQELWKYRIELIKCYDFLGIEPDESLINDIEVPPESFDLLLDTIELIGYDNETIKAISNNLPDNYDISEFPKKLIDEMIRINTKYRIAFCGESTMGKIQIINPIDGEFFLELDANLGFNHDDQEEYINCLDYSPTGQYIASGSSFGKINIWNTSTGKLVQELKNQHSMGINCLHFSPNSQQIATVTHGNKIHIWEISPGELTQIVTPPYPCAIGNICFSPCGKKIVYATGCRGIIWDIYNESYLRVFLGHDSYIRSICYSPDGKQIVTGGTNINIWNAIDGNLVLTIPVKDCIITVCYSPDGSQIISKSCTRTIEIWDALSGKLIRTLNVGNYLPISESNLCYSPDGKLIISNGSDKEIKIWDSLTGNLINTLNMPSRLTYMVSTIDTDNDLINRLLKN